ncbi:hypothetical protein [Thiorhodovibrio frisius]|uniref:Uncharacterized protein n=1 Tax=Thiorhodovibrio frisius TaxID=631362 RepID=H8Z4T7_9GAMM|nr:hypothetical protein [Thiorhodovibrio frisius]EIC20344.1 hypothetical protein Thi970DRAFT_03971 [Thiorhodovibrio frisius]WPL21082.1 hypothetical protein Thiofri_01190 [Thiorhodovibrio frisius]
MSPDRMKAPLLDGLTRRLAETPTVFLAEPRIGRRGQLEVAALVTDLLLALGGDLLTPTQAAAYTPKDKGERNRARLVAICCWLLHAECFRQRSELAAPIATLLQSGLDELAALIDAGRFVSDPERREELVRRVLSQLDLRPAGESEHQAADRLSALDSVERERVLRDTRARLEAERVRKLKKQMQARQAREAAAKANREW